MTAVSLRDLHGNQVSSASGAAVDAYDGGVRGLPGSSADIIDSFRAALAVSLLLAEQMPEARAEMSQAAAAPALSPGERRHVEALALRVAGRADDAIPLVKEIRAEHPRDMLLLQRLSSRSIEASV
jgi:hypothetical protein